MRLVWEPCRGCRDYAFCLEFVGIEQVADEGLRVIGFVEGVAKYKYAWFLCGRCYVCAGGG